MAGRPKMKMYEYDQNGKFIQEYPTQRQVFIKYYGGKARPLVREGKEYGILPNGNYICEKRLGRDKLMFMQKVEDSKYVPHKREAIRSVSAYNVLGEKIATFRSIYMASLMTGIPSTTIAGQARYKSSRRKYSSNHELLFKYEE